ncbi:hypothetical protein V8E36_004799 [Tilletia maclaganii]
MPGSGSTNSASTTRRPPVLNIGTYLLCTALDRVVHSFLRPSGQVGTLLLDEEHISSAFERGATRNSGASSWTSRRSQKPRYKASRRDVKTLAQLWSNLEPSEKVRFRPLYGGVGQLQASK